MNLLHRTMSSVCHHIAESDTGRDMTRAVPGNTSFSRNPDIPIPILEDVLDRVVHQSMSMNVSVFVVHWFRCIRRNAFGRSVFR